MCIHLFGSIILTVYDEMPLFCIRNLRWWWRNEGKTICCWISNLIYFGGLKPDVSFCSVELAPWLLVSVYIGSCILPIHGNIGKMLINPWMLNGVFPRFFSCFPYIFRYRTLITRWMNLRFGFPRCPHQSDSLHGWLLADPSATRSSADGSVPRGFLAFLNGDMLELEELSQKSPEISKLIGGLEHELYFSIYWEESSQLTFIFFRGVGQPPTSKNCSINYCTAI